MGREENSVVRMMQGNEACAHGAIAAGCRFFAGYPITPSSEIAEVLAKEFPLIGGHFIQMEDEISAMGAVIGASLGGVKSMTATSGPGFSLKQENFGYGTITEVPCVVVNVQRGGPSTGLPTLPAQGDMMQARWGTHGDHPVIAIYPNSVRETYELTIRAFNLAETYRTPVILLMDEIVAHVNEKVVIPPASGLEIRNREKPEGPPETYRPYAHVPSGIPPLASFGEGYRFHVTGLCHDETGIPTSDPEEVHRLIHRLHDKIEKNLDDIVEVECRHLEDSEVALFAYGSTSRAAKQAMELARAEGLKVGLIRPRTIWPFPARELRAWADRLKAIAVCELNMGQLAHEVEWAVGGRTEVALLSRVDGETMPPAQILRFIREICQR